MNNLLKTKRVAVRYNNTELTPMSLKRVKKFVDLGKGKLFCSKQGDLYLELLNTPSGCITQTLQRY